ncbi:MAG: D-2-hydroxyacid dehydrogenase [Acidimicrobiales bacterium]
MTETSGPASGPRWAPGPAVRVLVTEGTATAFSQSVASRFPGTELVGVRPDGSLFVQADGPVPFADALDIEIVWVTSDLYEGDRRIYRPFYDLVRRLDKLRWFQSAAAGFDAPLFGELIRRGVLFTKSDVHSIPISEYVLRSALDHVQRAGRWREAQEACRWDRHEFSEVFGGCWVVVGFGSIGSRVAQLASSLGARVIGVRRRAIGTTQGVEVVTPEALSRVLPVADVVVLTAPANSSTAHMVDRAFLAAMKPSALLINIGRGSVVDEDALLEALDAGQLDACVLDVFEHEPLAPESPLWRHPRMTVTPHNSASSPARMERSAELFCENLGRLMGGCPLLNEVTVSDLD